MATGSTSLTIPRPFVTTSTISSFVRARWLFWCQLSELDEPASRQRRNVTGYPFHFDSGAVAMGEVVLRAYETLREAGIKPFSFVCRDDPRMTLAPETYQRAIAVLLATGFELAKHK